VAVGIADGHHFPFNDDPPAYAGAICAWWDQKVATSTEITRSQSI